MSHQVVQPSYNAVAKNFWQGEKIRLRRIEPEDGETFYKWNLDTETGRLLDFLWPPNSLAATREWAQRLATCEIHEDRLFLVMEDHEGHAVGMISTHATNRRAGTFAYGISVNVEQRGRGYASEAIVLLLRYFFMELAYQKATIQVVECNPASIALHEKVGYQLEGRVRRMIFTQGQYYDELYYGMTREEFVERYGLR
jgi:RimJ/RimL family protein N-acetyltransferase